MEFRVTTRKVESHLRIIYSSLFKYARNVPFLYLTRSSGKLTSVASARTYWIRSVKNSGINQAVYDLTVRRRLDPASDRKSLHFGSFVREKVALIGLRLGHSYAKLTPCSVSSEWISGYFSRRLIFLGRIGVRAEKRLTCDKVQRE